MTKQDRINTIKRAQESILEAITQIDKATVEMDSRRRTKILLMNALKGIATGTKSERDWNLDSLIAKIKREK